MQILSLILLFLALVLPLNAEDWKTTDGNTYNDVTITSVDGDTVTISDQNGHDLVSLKVLPPNLLGKVRYFAAKAKDPNIPTYFKLNSVNQAKALAQQVHLPLAWICSWNHSLTDRDSPPESESGSTQMAIAALQGRAIVIFVAADDEWSHSPKIILDQLVHLDDGHLPDGHHFLTPKVVFSSPDVTKTFGRVSYTQMQKTQKAAIDAAIDAINNDPAAQAILQGQPASAPTAPKSQPSSNSTPDDDMFQKM